MRVAAHTYAFRDRLLPDALDEIVGLGFGAVEVWIGHVDGDVRRAAQAVAERELDVVAVCAGGLYDARSPAVDVAVELANALRTRRLVATVLPDVLEGVLERMPRELVLCVENHWDQPLARPRDLLRVLASHDRVLACLDTGHALLAGIEPDRFAASLGPRLGHVHLKDSRRATSIERALGRRLRRRLLPRPAPQADGPRALSIRRLRGELDRLGYSGAVSLEDEGHDAAAALATLRRAWTQAAPAAVASRSSR